LEVPLGVELQVALEKVDLASELLFEADPAIRSVGVGRNGHGFGFVAIRNVLAPMAFSSHARLHATPVEVDGIPVHYVSSETDPTSLNQVPHTGPGSPGTSLVAEQLFARPLVCGLQVQNFDHDLRSGALGAGVMTVGTLGCFVRLHNGAVAMLSNNHVLAGENKGVAGGDHILQPGGTSINPLEQAGVLTNYVPLRASPPGASMVAGNILFNDVDAALAALDPGVVHQQAYLPLRSALPPSGTAVAAVNERVHKVGRTTALTYGVIKQIGVQVGPVAYPALGGCWFRRSFVIEGLDGTTFSQPGDSGSAIVRDSDGAVLGLLFAGNGVQTYACPIAGVLAILAATLA
jgi:hypothetical protein